MNKRIAGLFATLALGASGLVASWVSTGRPSPEELCHHEDIYRAHLITGEIGSRAIIQKISDDPEFVVIEKDFDRGSLGFERALNIVQKRCEDAEQGVNKLALP